MATITNGLASGPLRSVKAVELGLFFEDSVFLLELLTVVPVCKVHPMIMQSYTQV